MILCSNILVNDDYLEYTYKLQLMIIIFLKFAIQTI